MSEDVEMLAGRVPSELKRRVDADPRANQKVLEDALKREFMTAEEAAIERRIEERQNRKQTYLDERAERDRLVREEEREIERLESTLEHLREMKSEESELVSETVEKASASIPEDLWTPDNEAVKKYAREAGISPTELINRMGDN
jgi:hypothetical protein